MGTIGDVQTVVVVVDSHFGIVVAVVDVGGGARRSLGVRCLQWVDRTSTVHVVHMVVPVVEVAGSGGRRHGSYPSSSPLATHLQIAD